MYSSGGDLRGGNLTLAPTAPPKQAERSIGLRRAVRRSACCLAVRRSQVQQRAWGLVVRRSQFQQRARDLLGTPVANSAARVGGEALLEESRMNPHL